MQDNGLEQSLLDRLNDIINVKTYARLRNLGWSEYEALMQSGVPITHTIFAAQYMTAFARQEHIRQAMDDDLAQLTVAGMWEKKTSLRALLDIIRSKEASAAARVAAIKTANEIAGFGEADLTSRALYRTLAEFYDAQRGSNSPQNPT